MKKIIEIIHSQPFRAEIKEVNETKKTARFTISDDTVDRTGDVVLPGAFNVEEFMKHPVLVANHNAHSSLLGNIGKILDITSKATMVDAQAEWFTDEGNPEADFGFKLMQKKIGAFSINFLPVSMVMGDNIKSDDEISSKIKKKNPFRVFKKIDLMEVSQVILPANRNALQKYLNEDMGVETLIAKAIIKENLIPNEDMTLEELKDKIELIEKQFIDLRNIVKIDSQIEKQIDEIANKQISTSINEVFNVLVKKEQGPFVGMHDKINEIIGNCSTDTIEKKLNYIKEYLG
ncbi:MAG: HK97 family phage prohead protease [Candidatus Anammoxibacter sp.]